MTKRALFLIFLFFVFSSFAVSAQPPKAKQNASVPKNVLKNFFFSPVKKIHWSVYVFTESHNFEFDSLASSKLVWSNLLMIGAGSLLEFPLKNDSLLQLQIEGARDVSGYSVDDDLRNRLQMVSYGKTFAEYAHVWLAGGKKKSLGQLNFYWFAGIAFTNHNLRMKEHTTVTEKRKSEIFYDITQDYDVFLLGPQIKLKFAYRYKSTVFSFFIQVGLPLYLALADWPYRNDFRHPISFMHHGFSIFTEFRLRSQTYFTPTFSMHLDYKLNFLYGFAIFNTVFLRDEKKPYHSSIHYALAWRTGVEVGMDFHF